MGNYKSTKDELKNQLFARIPLILIKSSERERVERMLRELAFEMKIGIYYYTDTKQVVSLNGGERKDVDRDPMQFVQELFRKKRGSTFVIGDVRRISDENAFSREILNTLYLAMETSGTLVLVTPDYIWHRIAQFGLLIELNYPDVEEREIQIQKFVKCYGSKYRIEWTKEEIHRAAMLLRGFTEVQIDNILISELVSKKELKSCDLLSLTSQKSRLYAAVPCVEAVHVRNDIQMSGLENLRQWMRERKQLFFVSDEVLDEYGLTAPKGILLSGVPGCGKSYSAKMIASEWELPLFRFDIGAIYDKWMGESERKFNDALTFIDHMAPCVVWIDEIEKALSVSDTGNDTGKRVLGQFLYWLQESKSRVFLVATANDVTSLPSELFRKGRFSEIFFIDLPNLEERKHTIVQYVDRCLHEKLTEKELERLAECSEGFSYSDIESVIKEAAQYLLLHQEERVSMELLERVFRENISFSSTNPEIVEKIRDWGRKRAVSASISGSRKGE